jgi:tetratricopeptide (TPR) repeat protein
MRKIAVLFMLIVLVVAGIVSAQDSTPSPAPTAAPSGQSQISGYIGLDIFTRAGVAFQNQDYQQSVTDYSLFILLNPTDSESYFRRASGYVQLNDYTSALADLKHALELPSPSSDLTGRMYALRAAIYIDQQQTDAAMADLNAGITAAPSLPTLYYQRGRLYAAQNQPEKALADFNKLVELAPTVSDGYALRAAVNTQLQNYDQALSDLNQLIILTPNDATPYADRAQIYIQQKKYEPALADLNDAIRLSPGSPGLYLLRGSVNNEMGNTADSAKDYFEWVRTQQTHINTDLMLRPGESQVVQLQAGQIYVMSFRAKAGQKVTISASARPGETTDPLLILMDSQANPLVANDDSGENYDAAIQDYTLSAGGDYGVIVGYARGGSDGPVRVLLQIAQ